MVFIKCLILVHCSSLPNPVNGRVTMEGTVLGSTANYSCDPGYSLLGNATILCQDDGAWSGSAVCQGMFKPS